MNCYAPLTCSLWARSAGQWLRITASAKVEDFPREGPFSPFDQKFSSLHEILQVRIILYHIGYDTSLSVIEKCSKGDCLRSSDTLQVVALINGQLNKTREQVFCQCGEASNTQSFEKSFPAVDIHVGGLNSNSQVVCNDKPIFLSKQLFVLKDVFAMG